KVVLGGDQLVEGGAGLVEEAAAGGELFGLLEQGGAGAGVQADLTRVRDVLAGQNAQQRRLTRPVRGDQPDALAMKQLKTNVFEQRAGVEAARQPGATEQEHVLQDRRIPPAGKGGL